MARVKNAIHMVSSEGTGFFYTTKKNPRKAEKLKLRKYDPKVRKHVEFTESKIARSKR
jgi:large subunit ribosomal protein L33